MPIPNLEPLHDVVLLQLDESKSHAGGFLLRQHETAELRAGVVVAVGPGRWSDQRGVRDPLSVRVGQRVRISSKSGLEVRDGEETYLAVSEREVLFVERGT